MHRIFLALGSNMGNRKQMIGKAIETLKEKIKVEKTAPVYETKPVGFKNQQNFYNTVLEGKTDLTPDELLDFVKYIEKNLGRQKRFLNGPREIDIDIIFYDDLSLKSRLLVIPHPKMLNRDFVLKPLSDIAPDFVYPLGKKTVSQLLEEINNEDRVVIGRV